jgi:hypothetical protein
MYRLAIYTFSYTMVNNSLIITSLSPALSLQISEEKGDYVRAETMYR